jgi:hypothetical protein
LKSPTIKGDFVSLFMCIHFALDMSVPCWTHVYMWIHL